MNHWSTAWGVVPLAGVALVLVLRAGSPQTPLGGVVPCPVQATTGVPCPGCGLTRAVAHAAHGNVVTSLAMHPLGIPLMLGIGVAAMDLFLRRRRRDGLPLAIRVVNSSPWAVVGIAMLLGIWTVRLSGGFMP